MQPLQRKQHRVQIQRHSSSEVSHCERDRCLTGICTDSSRRQEKSTQLVLDRVQQIEENLTEKMAKMEKLLQYFISKSDIPLPVEASPETSPEDPPQKTPKDATTTPNAPLESKPPTPSAPQGPEGMNDIPTAGSSQSDGNRDITRYLKTVQNVQSQPLIKDENREIDGELVVPQNHKTAAHKLLNWECIQRLLGRKIDIDYVLRSERKRGLIRLYGCGEGCDHDTEYQWRQNRAYPGGSPSTNTTTPRSDEEYTQASSPSWGYGLPMPSQSRLGLHYGNIDSSGYLNAQPDVVRRLVGSYMSNMQILHPIMDKNTLPQKVERFIQQYGQQHRNMDHGNIGKSANEGRVLKRKRSAEAMNTEALDMSRSPSFSSEKWASRRIEHSIDNAVILLILALGAICEHKGPMPGFAPDPNERHQDKQAFAPSPEVQSVLNEILSPPAGPVSGMNNIYYQSPSVQSPDPGWEWRTPSQRPNSRLGPEGMVEATNLKNIDVIPGLAYYAYAAGILGEMQGGGANCPLCKLPFLPVSMLVN